MDIFINERIHITEPSEDIIKYVNTNLVIPNPEYAKKQRLGFWLGNTPKYLHMYEKVGNKIILPFGCLRRILPYIVSIDTPHEFISFDRMDFGGTIPLYDYQEEAVKKCKDMLYGILQAPAGSGKTQMGLALAERWGGRTLWLTHTKDLLNQSKERAERYFDKSGFGEITEGKVNIGQTITFATIQTLSKIDLTQHRKTWDTIIVDECHRVAGTPTAVTQFSRVLNSLCAIHKYGLSATVHRSDGMIQATYSLLGDIICEIPESAVADKIMRVTIQPVRLPTGITDDMLNEDGTLNWARVISGLTEYYVRSKLIVDDLSANKGHSCLILSDRVNHLKEMMSMLPEDLQKVSAVIDGKMVSKKAKAERSQAIEDMRTGKKKYLFATYSLAKEGLDIPCLDRLFMTTPQKDYAVITQSIGRIARTCEGKGEPICYDYIDGIRHLEGAFRKRMTTYRKQKCNIKETRYIR